MPEAKAFHFSDEETTSSPAFQRPWSGMKIKPTDDVTSRNKKSPTASFRRRTPPGLIAVLLFHSAFFNPGICGRELMASICSS
ncbi:MAG TPA: hypothetical protein DEB39_03710 [Planctomycetaceae bacterium]|nr:hypothetical protein [Planctomycetaceae bacterium]